MDTGAFGLSTPSDLLAKLRHDYEALAASPDDAYLAFNFFVTAEHMVDWLHPAQADEPKRRALRDDPLLAIVSHLANGAKHFGPLKKHHKSVKESSPQGGVFPTEYFGSLVKGDLFAGGRSLMVTLDGSAAASYGATRSAINLARSVLAYWDTPGRV